MKKHKPQNLKTLNYYKYFFLFGILWFTINLNAQANKPNSILKDGEWYKMAVPDDGVYKLDYNFMQDEANLTPTSISFSSFGVFGQAMGLLPEYNGTPRTDDLEEIAIKIKDFNTNGLWDTEDYIIFYAKGPHLWHYHKDSNLISHSYNIYTEQSSYFFTPNKGTGLNLPQEASLVSSASPITTFDDWQLVEEELTNLMYSEQAGGAGSGRIWYGKEFNNINPLQEFTISVPDIVSTVPARIQVKLAAAATGASSTFKLKNNGNTVFSRTLGQLDSGDYPPLAKLSAYKGQIANPSSTFNLSLDFASGNPQGKGWLDYIELIATRKIKMNGSFVQFRSFESLNNSVSKFSLQNANANTEIWDVTNGTALVKINALTSGTNMTFARNSEILREYIAVDVSSASFSIPTFVKQIENQNLHALPNIDYVIITTPELRPAAQKLANFHNQTSGMSVGIVHIEEVYNEFSSGQQDLSAIRDFLKMFHDRNLSFDEKLKYVLLLGDASFDYKSRVENNSHLIPTYESEASLDPINSFCTDDYIGYLDSDEGLYMDSNLGDIDIAIGRIPVSILESANDVVEKIIYYKTNQSTNGWKNELTFVADDEDNNLHLYDAEDIIANAQIERKDYYNIDKIYLDSYAQSNSAGGDRYPDVVDAILRKLFTGTFFVDYTGHGGPTNWAQERVFNIEDIRNLDNKDKLPLFMTATCDFSPFDDPTIVSAGEALLLNPNGGAIAMLSTTRLVFSQSNKQMNKALLNYLFQKVNGRMPTIGEILVQAKNEAAGKKNNRKFVLLGDPALTLEYPKYEVVTTKINAKPIIEQDTMKALSNVSIEGGIMNQDGALISDFNGIIYANVYDKESTYTTKGNDKYTITNDQGVSTIKNGPVEFNLRNNLIFKGKASVINGKFSFEFIVPKDINYSFGKGKITYYAEKNDDATIDAHGYTYNFQVGGTDPDYVEDNEGPIVKVFMNDTNFVSGGITDQNPILFVQLSDESGINTIGNGVGHDLVGVLDENTQNQYLLNDYYESELDNFRKGNISYLLNDLAEGEYYINVKAWDVHNNPGEGFTEFIVSSSALLALENVLNYPNPFTTSTSFVFEHNRPNEILEVSIEIFSATGERVKTIKQEVQTEGYKVGANQISWDGLSDSGSFLGRGIYMYRVNVQTSTGDNEYKFEKLVILK